MSALADEERVEQLKSALWLHTGRLVDSLCNSIGSGANATPQFIAALTELVYAQVVGAGQEVEAFARHAGRDTVTVADVLMLARKNEELAGMLKADAQEKGLGKGTENSRGKGKAKASVK